MRKDTLGRMWKVLFHCFQFGFGLARGGLISDSVFGGICIQESYAENIFQTCPGAPPLSVHLQSHSSNLTAKHPPFSALPTGTKKKSTDAQWRRMNLWCSRR
jgi:hypothetical protein